MSLNAPKLRLLRFSRHLLQPSAPNADKLILFLTKVINAGYDFNLKYGVITSTRIKHKDVFLEDLGLYKPEAFMLVLVKTPGMPFRDDELKTVLSSNKLTIEEMTETFDPETDVKLEDVLGTLGGKLYDGTAFPASQSGWELTAVTSFARGAGSYLVNVMTDLALESNKDFLFASVIYDHNLVTYYNRFGYVEFGKRVLQKVDETGLVVGGDLELGIYATRDFQLAFLKKELVKA